jgi:hypothetical protein
MVPKINLASLVALVWARRALDALREWEVGPVVVVVVVAVVCGGAWADEAVALRTEERCDEGGLLVAGCCVLVVFPEDEGAVDGIGVHFFE